MHQWLQQEDKGAQDLPLSPCNEDSDAPPHSNQHQVEHYSGTPEASSKREFLRENAVMQAVMHAVLSCQVKKLSEVVSGLYVIRKGQKEINKVFAETIESQESKPIFNTKEVKHWNKDPERLWELHPWKH